MRLMIRIILVLGILCGCIAKAQYEDTSIIDRLSNEPPTTVQDNEPIADKNAPKDARKLSARARSSPLKLVYEGYSPDSEKAKGKGAVLEESIVLKTEFDYSKAQKRVHTERIIFLTHEQKNWLSLTRPREGVVLLGRVVESTRDMLRMEYLVIDTSSDDTLIATPVINAPIGQKTVISLDGAQEKVTVSVLSKYRSISQANF